MPDWIVSTELDNNLFDDSTALEAASKTWAASHMFSLFKLRSDLEKIVLSCSHGGEYKSTIGEGSQGKRRSSTIKTNCPFRVNGRKQSNGKWKMNLTNPTHNHARPQSLMGLANARRHSNTQRDEILRLSEANVRPRHIIPLLSESNLLKKRDIYNIIAAEKKSKLGDRSPLTYLLDYLQESNCFHKKIINDGGSLTSLFFSFEEGIALAKRFNTVFVVDATYKTNRFKLPLLHFIGIDCFNRSFSAGFMLMSKEDNSEYKRALESFRDCFGVNPSVFVTDNEEALKNAISIVFPESDNLLCIWHMNKNILKNCLNYFNSRAEFDEFMQDWNQVLYSTTEQSFNTSYFDLRTKYSENRCLVYLEKNVIPFKSLIAAAWTKFKKHLGNTVSSRAEGQHRVIKEYFSSSMGDLLSVVKNICLSSKNQYREFVSNIESEKLRK
jgi:hypothetical protein